MLSSQSGGGPPNLRREGDVGRGDDQHAVGPDQGGRVAGHHPQAHQELPRSGPAHSPDTYDLIGRNSDMKRLDHTPTYQLSQVVEILVFGRFHKLHSKGIYYF